MKSNYLILISVFVLFACKSKPENEPYSWTGNRADDMVVGENVPGIDEAAPEAPQKTTVEINAAEPQVQKEKKIIKDGTLQFEVSGLKRAKKMIDSILKKYNGYYSKEVLYISTYESTYELKARIPNKNFELFVAEVEACDGKMVHKSINARDVTEQFVDLETRLENKRSYLNRYRELLKKAKTIKDILQIEEKIRQLEEEIESVEGKLKYLGDQVAYSSLEIFLTQKKEYKYQPRQRDSFGERLKSSISKGWFSLIDFLLAILRIWPFWIFLILGLYIWKIYRKRKKERNN